MRKTQKDLYNTKFFVLLFFLLVGVCISTILTPPLYRILPSDDLQRLFFIHKAIEEDAESGPEIVILGNSMVMNGVDGKLLSDVLPTHPVVWNLSSPGQLPQESMIISSILPSGVKTVVWGVAIDAMIFPQTELPENKAVAYRMYGYDLDLDLIAFFKEIGLEETTESLMQPYWCHVIKSRTAVINSTNMMIRQCLRRDLRIERSIRDIYYPSPYTSHISDEIIRDLAEKYYIPRNNEQSDLHPDRKNFFRAFDAFLKQKNCCLILLIMPDQPLHQTFDEEDYYGHIRASIKKFQLESGIVILDAMTLLTKEYFVDHVHPDQKGAEQLTRWLGIQLMDL